MLGLLRSVSRRASTVVLVLAAALAGLGAGALVLAPTSASAGVTPGVKPDFVVNPGDTVPMEFSQPLIGSAEVKSHPDDCRNNPAIGLTCAAHRLKVNRTPDKNFQLRITLEWQAEGDPTLAQVPDLDLYLFDNPTSAFDSTKVGGAGSTSPEQIKIVPAQDEYDIVVQAYAGAVTGYKLTVSYLSSATLTSSVTPDIVLTPHAAPFQHDYSSVIVAGQPLLSFFPDACRSQPGYEQLCDVYRIKLNRNLSKDATNFVVIQLDWSAVTVPALNAVATGLVSRPVPDLNMYVYDAPDHALDGIGGTSIENVPEQLGFVATQDEYDLVIQSAGGTATSYKLTAFLSDEVFTKPFELLDPLTGKPITQAPDGESTPVSTP
ncbi:MAG TPA: hypothetical protein VHD87_16105, partial [Acidimicrobiales bacterium]|nr:hypothetical protein [Acidimicrobiales bacterium]